MGLVLLLVAAGGRVEAEVIAFGIRSDREVAEMRRSDTIDDRQRSSLFVMLKVNEDFEF